MKNLAVLSIILILFFALIIAKLADSAGKSLSEEIEKIFLKDSKSEYISLVRRIWEPTLEFLRMRKVQSDEVELNNSNLLKYQEFSIFATKLAHDIRSPLSALSILADRIQDHQNTESKLLKKVILRIEGIASDLLSNYRKKNKPEVIERIEFEVYLDEIVAEKKLEYCAHKFLEILVENCCGTGDFEIGISGNELKRIISNLINNSIEAKANKVEIQITNQNVFGILNLVVKDNGMGFPTPALGTDDNNDFLSRVSTKARGNGLGLSAASDLLKSLGGKLRISNGDQTGARVQIEIPLFSRAI